MKALKRPSAAVVDCFMKKDTVIGTIGNTHGVINMANPHRMASIIKAHNEPSLLSSSSETIAVEVAVLSVVESAATSSAPSETSPAESADVPSAKASCDTSAFTCCLVSSDTENSHVSGAAQNLSLHPLHDTSPVTVATFPVNLTLCFKVTESKKTFSP